MTNDIFGASIAKKSNVQPSLKDQYARYDTDITVAGVDGILPTFATPEEIDYVWTATGEDTGAWVKIAAASAESTPEQKIAAAQGQVFVGDKIFSTSYPHFKTVKGRVYDTATLMEVALLDGHQVPTHQYPNMDKLCNITVVATIMKEGRSVQVKLPETKVGTTTDWSQLELQASLGYSACVAGKLIGVGKEGKFLVMQKTATAVTAVGVVRIYEVDDYTGVATFLFEKPVSPLQIPAGQGFTVVTGYGDEYVAYTADENNVGAGKYAARYLYIYKRDGTLLYTKDYGAATYGGSYLRVAPNGTLVNCCISGNGPSGTIKKMVTALTWDGVAITENIEHPISLDGCLNYDTKAEVYFHDDICTVHIGGLHPPGGTQVKYANSYSFDYKVPATAPVANYAETGLGNTVAHAFMHGLLGINGNIGTWVMMLGAASATLPAVRRNSTSLLNEVISFTGAGLPASIRYAFASSFNHFTGTESAILATGTTALKGTVYLSRTGHDPATATWEALYTTTFDSIEIGYGNHAHLFPSAGSIVISGKIADALTTAPIAWNKSTTPPPIPLGPSPKYTFDGDNALISSAYQYTTEFMWQFVQPAGSLPTVLAPFAVDVTGTVSKCPGIEAEVPSCFATSPASFRGWMVSPNGLFTTSDGVNFVFVGTIITNGALTGVAHLPYLQDTCMVIGYTLDPVPALEIYKVHTNGTFTKLFSDSTDAVNYTPSYINASNDIIAVGVTDRPVILFATAASEAFAVVDVPAPTGKVQVAGNYTFAKCGNNIFRFTDSGDAATDISPPLNGATIKDISVPQSGGFLYAIGHPAAGGSAEFHRADTPTETPIWTSHLAVGSSDGSAIGASPNIDTDFIGATADGKLWQPGDWSTPPTLINADALPPEFNLPTTPTKMITGETGANSYTYYSATDGGGNVAPWVFRGSRITTNTPHDFFSTPEAYVCISPDGVFMRTPRARIYSGWESRAFDPSVNSFYNSQVFASNLAESKLFLLTGVGYVYETLDSGDTPFDVMLPGSPSVSPGGAFIGGLSGNTSIIGGTMGELFLSTDDWQTNGSVVPLPASSRVSYFSRMPVGSTACYGVTEDWSAGHKIFRLRASTGWTTPDILYDITAAGLPSVKLIEAHNNFICAVTIDGTLIYSKDSGAAWATSINNPLHLQNVYTLRIDRHRELIFIGGNGGLYSNSIPYLDTLTDWVQEPLDINQEVKGHYIDQRVGFVGMPGNSLYVRQYR